MGRIPIDIEKIKTENNNRYSSSNEVTETVKYLFKIVEKGQQWEKTFTCDRNDLLKFRNEIDKLIEAIK